MFWLGLELRLGSVLDSPLSCILYGLLCPLKLVSLGFRDRVRVKVRVSFRLATFMYPVCPPVPHFPGIRTFPGQDDSRTGRFPPDVSRTGRFPYTYCPVIVFLEKCLSYTLFINSHKLIVT